MEWFASFSISFAFSSALPPLLCRARPPTISIGATVKAPNTVAPPAIPRPPTFNAPPPKAASAALLAAAPERADIAVPVDAAVMVPTKPPEVAKPIRFPAATLPIPPRIISRALIARTLISCNSSNVRLRASCSTVPLITGGFLI